MKTKQGIFCILAARLRKESQVYHAILRERQREVILFGGSCGVAVTPSLTVWRLQRTSGTAGLPQGRGSVDDDERNSRASAAVITSAA